MNKTQNVCFCIQVPRQSDFIVYFKTGSFIVASNKQMVDLTYLRFVFLNDRSDAWWEMQWAACRGRDNSRGRAYRSCIHLVPSLLFKVSIFKNVALLLGVARAAVPRPSSHWQDEQLMGKLAAFSDEADVLHWGRRGRTCSIQIQIPPIFIYLFSKSFIHLFIQFPGCPSLVFGCRLQTGSSPLAV